MNTTNTGNDRGGAYAFLQRERLGSAFGNLGAARGGFEHGLGDPGGRPASTLDLGVIETLHGLERRRPGMVRKLAEAFVAQAPALLGRMRAGATAGDLAALERLAHDLKADSGHLGARRLSLLAGDLQISARKGGPIERCDAIVGLVGEEFAHVLEAMASAGLVD